jgi:hypothetical protein
MFFPLNGVERRSRYQYVNLKYAHMAAIELVHAHKCLGNDELTCPPAKIWTKKSPLLSGLEIQFFWEDLEETDPLCCVTAYTANLSFE